MDPSLLKRNSYLQPSARRKPALPTVTFSRIVYGIISLLWISYFLLLKHDYDHPVTAVNRCEQPKPAAPPSNLSGFTDAPGFAEDSARRLAGAVKIPTMSFDDMGPVEKDTRWAPFKEMHSYLRTTFPTLHSSLDLTVVGGYSLIYTWPGSVKDSKPLMLTAHLDVVPSLTALDRWIYPPFAGIIDGDWIYGRGSGDCKNNLIGILTAVEHLVSSGWKPQRTIILAFGQDEEISGPRGANNIGKYLEEKYGKNGIGMIVDEGGMNIETAYGTEFALPGIAEKGYLNAIIEVDMLGGQQVSSIPPPHTSIGILSKIVTAIEDSPVFQPHIETASPIWGYLSCVSQHGKSNLVPDWIRKGIQSKKPKMNKIAKKFAEMSVGNRYLLQTSKAPTIFNAGLKSNALAESASVFFNSRIDLFSSPAKVREEYRNLIKPVAEKYSLLFEGAAVSAPPYIGNITVNWKDPHEPSPISPFQIDSPAWLIFSRAVQASFGADVVTAPSAMTGNTDTRYYWNLSKNIYRWSPTRAGTKLNIHTIDEKIKIKTHVEGIKFYTELILQSDGMAHVQVD